MKPGPHCGSLRLSQRCGPAGPTSPKPPPLERSGRPGPRPEPACQPGVQLEPDVTGLTSPAAALSVAPPTPPPHTHTQSLIARRASPKLRRCLKGRSEGISRARRGAQAEAPGRTAWGCGCGSGAPGALYLALKGSGAHAEPGGGDSGR